MDMMQKKDFLELKLENKIYLTLFVFCKKKKEEFLPDADRFVALMRMKKTWVSDKGVIPYLYSSMADETEKARVLMH